ncbi:hypothetical protein B0H67DRAFT_567766 [Lasiosphaeris hirsuta]|uniref:Uncharacterized protein n=1 Tax=Lasiosphaeris hirsuta TaxID=260670 RepID=A0AA40AYJ8_9PEZI|nr:hypothetical protein B0H67DRAFT_567766 [Lasiosphaeris hirsuta]
MLVIDTFFGSSFLGQLRSIIHMPPSRDTLSPGCTQQPVMVDDSEKGTGPQTSRRPARRNLHITRPEPGSIYDTMFEHAGTSLYVLPICWTDLHTQLLGARFSECPAIVKPVPELVPGRFLEPSNLARALTAELHILVKHDSQPARMFSKNRAIKHVMATLFSGTLSRPKTGAELDIFFGQRIFRKAIRIPCMWKSPSGVDTSFDSAPTIPATSFKNLPPASSPESSSGYAPNQPVLAYVNRGQLAMIRENLFRVVLGPNHTPNEPVARLQRLRSKLLIPANLDHDPYLIGILLAMAQAHFYHKGSSSKSSSQSSNGSRSSQKSVRMPTPNFHDVKVQIITHDEGNDSSPNFIVYTAVVSAAFLSRFMDPHKAPTSTDDANVNGGIHITHTPVTFWPILGLKERLAKALGHEIAGEPLYGDPDHIGLWDMLVDQPAPAPVYPATNLKRRRTERAPLSEVLNSSFEEETSNSSEDCPVLSPDAKRRRTARPANPLEVC